jgi:hypothetical protein
VGEASTRRAARRILEQFSYRRRNAITAVADEMPTLGG